MIKSATVTPPNSLVLIRGRSAADIPVSGEPVAVTNTCVSVGTLMEYDGETTVRVMDAETAAGERLPALEVFSGSVSVSGGVLVIASAVGDEYVEWPCADGPIAVRVYTNHSTEPDEIDVVIG